MLYYYTLLTYVLGFNFNYFTPHVRRQQFMSVQRQNIFLQVNESFDETMEEINRKINFSLSKLKSVVYDQKNDLWIMDIGSHDDDVDESEEEDDMFSHEVGEDDMASHLNPFNYNNFHDANLNKVKGFPLTRRESYGEIDPTSKDLKMLNNVITIEWSKNWIKDMVRYQMRFPSFMYHDMFIMRDFAIQNTSERYFYIGYYPSEMRTIHGPYYIGAFELIPGERTFTSHLIVQNPNYMVEDDDCKKRMINFKKELRAMCEDALVFFKFNLLKNKSNDRYYLTWLYEDDA